MISLLLSHWIPLFGNPSSPSSNCLMDQNVRSSHPSIRQSKHQPRRKKRKGRGCFQRSQIRHFPKLVLRYQCLQMWVWHEKRWTEAMAFIDRSPVARTAMFFNGFVCNVCAMSGTKLFDSHRQKIQCLICIERLLWKTPTLQICDRWGSNSLLRQFLVVSRVREQTEPDKNLCPANGSSCHVVNSSPVWTKN